MIKKVVCIVAAICLATISAIHASETSPVLMDDSLHETPNDVQASKKTHQRGAAYVVTEIYTAMNNLQSDKVQMLLDNGANPFVQGQFGAPTVLREAILIEQTYRNFYEHIKNDTDRWRRKYCKAKSIRLSLTFAYMQANIDEYPAQGTISKQ